MDSLIEDSENSVVPEFNPKVAMDFNHSPEVENHLPTNDISLSTSKSKDLPHATTTDPDSYNMLQLINEEKEFNLKMSEYMKDRWKLYSNGFDFDVVAILGSQSTGKSTLLNALFKTDFDVLRQGKRQQTTKGIWMDRAENTNILVMDVEGTDGRERGEDQDFERKSALFSMAIAEVVIVNMWENMVGLYNGANMGLLKTVFEVNLLLFGRNREAKTLLYFVIRDHVSPTSTEILGSVVSKDLERIWSELSKPEEFANEKLFDYFDIRFTSLSHKLLQEEKFYEGVQEIWKDFTMPRSSGYVFRPEYKRKVPADGFSRYLETVWEKIVTNKELDLPTQQELLSQYRCDEILQSVLIPFTQSVDSIMAKIRSGDVINDLGSTMEKTVNITIEAFSEQASRYHKNVYTKKRNQLYETVIGELRKLFVSQIRNAIEKAASQYESKSLSLLDEIDIDSNISSLSDEPSGLKKGKTSSGILSFSSIVEDNRKAALDYLETVVKFSNVDSANWDYQEEIENLNKKLDKLTIELRGNSIQRMLQQLCDNRQEEFSGVISDILNSAPTNLWEQVLCAYIAQLQSMSYDVELLIESMGTRGLCNESNPDNSDPQSDSKAELNLIRARFRQLLFDLLFKICKEDLNDQMILYKLRNKFEEKFRYTPDGVPKIWSSSDDIDSRYNISKKDAINLLPLYSKIDFSCVQNNVELQSTLGNKAFFYPEEPIAISTPLNLKKYSRVNQLELISSIKQREIQKRAIKEIDMLFLDAKRSVVSRQSQIPVWMFGLLVLLGWNEAMAVLFNPIYLILAITIGTLGFIVHNLGLWGPVMGIVHNASANATVTLHNLAVYASNITDPSKMNRTEEIELSQMGKKSPSSSSFEKYRNQREGPNRSLSRSSTGTSSSDSKSSSFSTFSDAQGVDGLEYNSKNTIDRSPTQKSNRTLVSPVPDISGSDYSD
ncbi:hypothetical protein BB560_000449 [Smittium megazygosporum]|uniref:GB1/RHD3-type G domain-containing protein n=1 Tax=Smittium megazygosporum TaxID=133381 RepID=A0A2T9ZKB9_9FUNG|nr:hypothetical protein BB560_000449 [Smittium megazygosporum]